MCGEHFSASVSLGSRTGSSPRVWGTSRRRWTNRRRNRFIPTCVGNMSSVCAPGQPLTVHPHVCGEHGTTRALGFTSDGSSPRVWGTFAHVVGGEVSDRFIPTCVGNMRAISLRTCAASVHPHVCGEHEDGLRMGVPSDGSSPRVWGTYLPRMP